MPSIRQGIEKLQPAWLAPVSSPQVSAKELRKDTRVQAVRLRIRPSIRQGIEKSGSLTYADVVLFQVSAKELRNRGRIRAADVYDKYPPRN